MGSQNDKNVVDIQTRQSLGKSGNGGNGGVLEYRVGEIERRLSVVEADVKKVNDICIEINTKMENLATNSFVWKIFAGALGLALLTLVGHALIRWI